MTKFLATLPPDLHRWLKIAAAERCMSMNELLTLALENHRELLLAADVAVGQPEIDRRLREDDKRTGRPLRPSVWTDTL
jgi:hypothetical protein